MSWLPSHQHGDNSAFWNLPCNLLKQRGFIMGDMRYMKILKLCPVSQMFHFHTTTRRDLLSTNASTGRKRESKIGHGVRWIMYCLSCPCPSWQVMCMYSSEDVQLCYYKVFLMISTSHTVTVSVDLKHLITQFFSTPFFPPRLLSLFILFPSFLNDTVTWISSVFLLQSSKGWTRPGWLEITVFHCKPGYLEKQTFDDGDYLVPPRLPDGFSLSPYTKIPQGPHRL